MEYRFVFLDMDNTLLDTQGSEAEILQAMFGAKATPGFVERYREINAQCWRQVAAGEMRRQALRRVCFERLLTQCRLQGDPEFLGGMYEEQLAAACRLYPDTQEALARLRKAGVTLFVASNGEGSVQRRRLALAGIGGSFEECFFSSEIGALKPQKRFFRQALAAAGIAQGKEALMVGDDEEADIAGACAAGLDSALLHYGKKRPVSTKARYAAPSLIRLVEALTQ